jgi:uncharacterized membrane protein
MQRLKWMVAGSALTLLALGVFQLISNDASSLHVPTAQLSSPKIIDNPGSLYTNVQARTQNTKLTSSDFTQVESIIHQRCTVCHSSHPTSPLFSEAPAAVLLDTPEQIRQMASRIKIQAVDSTAMPLGNVTQMTQTERALIGRWILQAGTKP